VIPEATETIVGVMQSGSTDSVVWISIIGPVMGGILATAAGALFTSWQWRREEERRRMTIASGLWIDLSRTHRKMAGYPPSTNREAAQEFITRVLDGAEPIELFPRYGIFATRYADIITLGAALTLEIESFYHRLEMIERYLKRMRDDPQERAKRFAEEGETSIFGLIDHAKFMVKVLELKMEKIFSEDKGILKSFRRIIENEYEAK